MASPLRIACAFDSKKKGPAFLVFILSALTLACASPAQASVTIAGTRVIYKAGERETTIKISNEGKTPALVQSWLDKGDANSSPSSNDVPFLVTPPLTRIDPGKSQTLRIFYLDEPLPQDKESVFWLNVLDVPPKAATDTADANQLQIAFRSRIKLFFRPKGLQGSAEEAPAQVRWRMTQSGGRPAIEASNPTPYHVSFAEVELVAGGKHANSDGGMVNPKETAIFPLTGDVGDESNAVVRYQSIGDYGGIVGGETTMNDHQTN